MLHRPLQAIIARFKAERQALAIMDHPNIAQVFDAGTTEDGRLFVMELVKGLQVTDYCNKARLTPRKRLELMVAVCFGAYAGGAPWLKAAVRVTFWGALAMAITAGVGAVFGAAV